MPYRYIREEDLDAGYIDLQGIEVINIGQNSYTIMPNRRFNRISIDTAKGLLKVIRVRVYSEDENEVPSHENYDILDGVVYEYHTDKEGQLLIEFYPLSGIDTISFMNGYPLQVVDAVNPHIVLPLSSDVTINLGQIERFNLPVQIIDENPDRIEVSSTISMMEEFVIYANEQNPYGDQANRDLFTQSGSSLTYNEEEQLWNISFPASIVTVGATNFNLYAFDKSENTYRQDAIYNIEREQPSLNVTPLDTEDIEVPSEGNFKINILFLGDLPGSVRISSQDYDLTMFADSSNPYGDNQQDFNDLGVSVVYNNKTWTVDFGPVLTAEFKNEGVQFQVIGWNENSLPAQSVQRHYTFIVEHEVTFNSNGGSAVASQTIEEGSKAIKPSNPTREGYTFIEWQLNNAAFDFDTEITEEITLTALWEINEYVISFNTDGGNTLADLRLDFNSEINLPTPVKEGNTFKGWLLDGSLFNLTNMPASDLELVASWEVNNYTITFNSNGGSNINAITQAFASNIQAPVAPTRIGYTFIEWQLNGNTFVFDTIPAQNITLVAVWEINEHTVTFNSDGGSVVPPQTIEEGNNATKPANPTREGFNFLGWFIGETEFNFETAITGDTTLTAKWEEIEHEVTFVWGHGIANETDYVLYGMTIGEPAAKTVEGYNFLGWTLNNASFNFTTPITENLVLVADWEVNEYTITFNSDGGSAVNPITQDFATNIQAPTAPTREGHTFIEWQLNGNAFVFNTMPAQNTTLVALWDVNEYTITFNSNGGSAINNLVLDFNSNITLQTPVREGYTFNGWLLNGEAFNLTTMPANDLALVASWEVNNYTITFDADGGSSVGQITTAFGSNIQAPTAPTKAGHTFIEWQLNGSTYVFDTMPANNLALVASWDINEYTITFDSNGGTAQANLTLEFNDEIALPTPVRVGHTFVGWLLGGSPFNSTNMPANNLALVADWEVNQYTITFDTDGGNVIDNLTLDFNDEIELPTPEKADHTFVGWLLGSNPFELTNMPANNLALVADWEEVIEEVEEEEVEG